MQEIKRKYVIPGDVIIEGNFKPVMNVIRKDNSIIATRIGIAEAGRDGIKVIPLSGVYIPRVNDIVIGKVLDNSSLSWEVDINSCFSAHLPAQDVFGRDFSPARDDMRRQLSPGDLITARIIAFDRSRDPMLTLQDKDLGKIPKGELIKISSTRVPRLIGKRGSMIQTIEQATHTRILIGQNGLLVVTGRDSEGFDLAIKAIRMVEEEAHTSNLTQRIKSLLNVPDTDNNNDNSSNDSPTTTITTTATSADQSNNPVAVEEEKTTTEAATAEITANNNNNNDDNSSSSNDSSIITDESNNEVAIATTAEAEAEATTTDTSLQSEILEKSGEGK